MRQKLYPARDGARPPPPPAHQHGRASGGGRRRAACAWAPPPAPSTECSLAVRLERVFVRHDAEELLLVDLTVAVEVGLVDHLLQLLVGHVLAQLACDALEVPERDL